ncbi:MFS transporter [Myroides injenensis]|uniref:MFS transporter n=1 Tax=Myroides injenensis TaxID=1183151 RepID=UPI00028A31D0|nr:MFS transporter [Myroides injenensis]
MENQKPKYNQGLFHDWVPKPVMLLLLILIGLVFFCISGIYTTDITYLVGSTGAMTEYFMWANYATVVGMGVVMPLVIRLKARFRVKEILIFALLGIAISFMIMGTTKQPQVIVAMSFLIGFFKMLGMMEIILPLMFLLSKDGNRGRFYSFFYTAILITTQIATYYMTQMSYYYNWQYGYFFFAALSLITAGVCVIFQHNLRFMKKVPLYYVDWFSILLYVSSFLVLGYILSFGKQQDWYRSPSITNATILFVLLSFMFFLRQQLLKRPFISLKAFKKNNVRHAIVMLFFLGMYLGTTSMQNSFAIGILHYTPLRNASLNLMIIPGLLLAAVVSYKWFNNEIPIRMLAFTGFSAYLMYTIFMYFYMVPELNYTSWLLPMLFKGYGMGVLFNVIWYYMLDKLDIPSLLSLIGFAIAWRTFISVGIFTSFFSWLQYKLQFQSIANLAVNLDDLILYQPGNQISLQSVQINAILASYKTVYGYINLAGIGILAYVLTHHFGRSRDRMLMGLNKMGQLLMSSKTKKSIENQLPIK